MRSFAIATLLSVVCAVNAANHTVIAGQNGKFAFVPATLVAAVGDNVTIEFQSGPHSIMETDFEHPCTQLSGSSVNSKDKKAGQTYKFTVTKSIMYMACGEPGHCKQGMTLVVNPDKNYNAWQAAAKAGTSPSSAAGSGSAASTDSSTGSNTSGAATATATATASDDPDDPESTSSGSGSATSAADTSADSASPSSSANKIAGGGFLSAAMALLVGLAL